MPSTACSSSGPPSTPGCGSSWSPVPAGDSAPGPSPTTWPPTWSGVPTSRGTHQIRTGPWPLPATASVRSSTPSWPTTSGFPSRSSPPSTARRPASGSPCRATATCGSPPRGPGFTTAHGRLGLPCAFGLAWLLPKLIGLSRAMDLILSSRTFAADEALQLGLVTDVVPGDQLVGRVTEYARRLATTVSPASMAASKRQVYEAFHLSAAESVRAAEALLDPMMAGPDYREGVAALREKRPPSFVDLPEQI